MERFVKEAGLVDGVRVAADRDADGHLDGAELGEVGRLARDRLGRLERAGDVGLALAVRAQRLRLQLTSGSQLAMFRAAEQLAQDHPRTALDLLSHSLPIALPEERTGGVFILAGDLALRAKDAVRAESYWLAALAFPEGARICERLARLLLVQGRLEAARKAYALTNDPTDPALAARFELIKIAATLLGDVLQQEPTDLLTHAALAIFSDAPMLDWKQEDDEMVQQILNTFFKFLFF